MPRKNKAIKKQKTDAAAAWQRGERKEAQDLWAKADKARKELQAKKKKNKQGVAAPAPAAPAS